ncbi:MAG: PIG-L family deacetylase [Aquihabitans sp.]
MVVAPHPDDEVLGAAGIIVVQSVAAARIDVIAVTNGEAAYPDSDPTTLAELRRKEQGAALDALAEPIPSVHCLGFGDGRVQDHESDLYELLGKIVLPDDLLVAPWEHDHHCDHEAVGRVAAKVTDDVGCTLASSLFWAWQHTDPTIEAEATIRRLELDTEALARRSAAMACHRTQVSNLVAPPILSTADLEPLTWSAEYYLVRT